MFSSPEANIGQFEVYEGLTVADIGAGSGFYTLALAKHVGSTGRVYAIDIQKDFLEKIKNEARQLHLHNVEVIYGNAEKAGGIHLNENSVHRAVVANIFFQVENRKAFIMEVKRILRPGGRVLLIDWTENPKGVGPHNRHVVIKSDARKLFEEGGFSFEKEIPAGDHHYGMILRKNPR